MTKRVRGDGFVYSGKFGSLPNRFLENAWICMVAHCLSLTPGPSPRGRRGSRTGKGREDILPSPFMGGGRIFAGKSVGEVDFSKTLFEVFLVNERHALEVQVEVGDERVGEDGDAVVFAFSVADQNLIVAEVNILNSKPKTFHEAKPGTV